MKSRIFVLFIISAVTILYSFSILSSSGGYYRKYFLADLPFSYKVHNSASQNWLDVIETGALTWNKVKGAYFAFSYGGTTTVSSLGRDYTNLVYFDATYQNFTPGSNTIAFSSTFTSGGGSGFHAVESDLIYNAGGYPPSTTGNPAQMDLQSIITHEFGHHLGLGHAGPAGSPPGVGNSIPEATMYGTASLGDTTERSLHIDDIMGVIAIYPRWIIQGNVKNSITNLPITNAYYHLNGLANARLDPLQSFGGRWQIAGYTMLDENPVGDILADFLIYGRSDSLSLTFDSYGYEGVDTLIVLDTTSIDSILDIQVKLNPTPIYSLTVNLVDSITQTPVEGVVEFYSTEDPFGTLSAIDSTTGNGLFTLTIVKGPYEIKVFPELPYERIIISDYSILNDTTITIELNHADILLLDDDYESGMSNEDNVESYYMDAIMNMANKQSYTYIDYAVDALPDSLMLLGFDKLIWFTGGRLNPVIPDTSLNLLTSYLDQGGKLFMSGQNIISSNQNDSLFSQYAKISLADDSSGQVRVYNLPGDTITGDFTQINISGDEGANNQVSQDVINVNSGAEPIFRYWPRMANRYAASRTESFEKDYKVVFLAFGFEAITDLSPVNSGELRANILEKIFDWFEQPILNVIEETEYAIPLVYDLKQNYPNPFNPQTSIRYSVASAGKVVLIVYDILGKKVTELVNETKKAGAYDIIFDGSKYASGLYFYRLQSGDFIQSRKMLLVR